MAKKKTYGKTATGKRITDELVKKLAERAEAGYDVEETLRRRGGRPPIGSAAASVESVRLDPELRQALPSEPSGTKRPPRRSSARPCAGISKPADPAEPEVSRATASLKARSVPSSLCIRRMSPPLRGFRRQTMQGIRNEVSAARASIGGQAQAVVEHERLQWDGGRRRELLGLRGEELARLDEAPGRCRVATGLLLRERGVPVLAATPRRIAEQDQ